MTEIACNGTIIQDKDMGEVIQLQGDHRTKVMDFLTDKDKEKMGKYALAKENIKVKIYYQVPIYSLGSNTAFTDPRILTLASQACSSPKTYIGLSGEGDCSEKCVSIDGFCLKGVSVFGIGKEQT